MSRLPRVALVSTTSMDVGSASGRAVQELFRRWDPSLMAQAVSKVYAPPKAPPHIPTFELGGSWHRSPRYEELRDFLRDFAPDVVHVRAAENPEAWWSFGRSLADEFDCPYILHVWDDVVEWNRSRFEGRRGILRSIRRERELDLSIAGARGLAACSQAQIDDLAPLPHTLTGTFIRPAAAGAAVRKRPPGAPLVLAYTGRCNPQQHREGFDELLRAIEEVRNEGHDVVLRCSGYRPEEFSDAVAEFPETAAFVEIVGDLSDDDRWQFIADADALAITFNFRPETIGFSRLSISGKALDALTTDLPIIVHGSREMESVRWAADEGWATATSEYRDLVATLRRLVSGAGVPESQRQARERLRHEWSEPIVLDRWEAFVQEVAEQGRPSL